MKKNIKKDKILLFATQLNSLLKSGLTVAYSINILYLSENDKNFRIILKKILKSLNSGKNIFDSFKNFKDIFGKTFLNMLKIGELSGVFNDSLDNAIEYLEYSLESKRKIISLLIYPIVVLTITLFLLTFLLIFIFPNFISIFEENEIQLPLTTRILLFLSNNFVYIFFILVFALVTLYLAFRYINNNKNLRFKKDKSFLNIFIFGNLLKLSLAEEIFHSLYIFLEAGINIIDALDIISENIDNTYIKLNLLAVRKEINSGENISESLRSLGLFNERFQSFINSGEESGFLSKTFLEISKILKKDYEYKIKKYIALIEPLSIICLGLIISFIVFSIYIPIFAVSNIF